MAAYLLLFILSVQDKIKQKLNFYPIISAYAQQLEGLIDENMAWWTELRKRVVKLRAHLEEEEKVHNTQHGGHISTRNK